jgi:hypothetical protein
VPGLSVFRRSGRPAQVRCGRVTGCLWLCQGAGGCQPLTSSLPSETPDRTHAHIVACRSRASLGYEQAGWVMSRPSAVPARPTPSHTPTLASADATVLSQLVSPSAAHSEASWSQSQSRAWTGARGRPGPGRARRPRTHLHCGELRSSQPLLCAPRCCRRRRSGTRRRRSPPPRRGR